MNQKFDFKITPIVERYLDEIITYWNDYESKIPQSEIQFAEPLRVKTYLVHELGNGNDELNRLKLVKWLSEKNVIELIYKEDSSGHRVGDDDYVSYPNYLHMRVRNIKPVLRLKQVLVLQQQMDDNGRFLFFDEGTASFLYGKQRKDLGLNTSAVYYKILASIYFSADNNGETTVSKIQRVMRHKFGHKAPVTRKDVQNNLNKSVKDHLSRKLPAGHTMFKWKRGTDTLIFDNPLMHKND